MYAKRSFFKLLTFHAQMNKYFYIATVFSLPNQTP